MDESYYYHAIAVAARGGYAAIKRYHDAGGGSWEAAYRIMKENVGLWENIVPIPDPQEAHERMAGFGIRLALFSDGEYPEALRHIPHPPFGIYLRGGAMPAAVRNRRAIAVVGTRRASADGKKTARAFARELAGAGFVIASGLAFGIDAAAHEGALDAGAATVAVLAGGLDSVYPHSHEPLARRILENDGTLISEYPPEETPFGYRFIERNRIISGISRGVLIVEAPAESGALATARYALEQNRDVFVVPGAVTTNNFKGSHALIRQGAELVTSPDDILEACEIDKRENAIADDRTSSPDEILILKALAGISGPADVDKLVALTRLEPRALNQSLSFLLIRGIIKESGTGYTI